MKTLIAEDDPTSRLILQEFLKVYGRVITVDDGERAVESVCHALDHGEPFDLILLDIMMPRMDGQEALRRIREELLARDESRQSEPKIIMTTALGDMKNVSAAFEGLCDAYLVKPIARERLTEELKSLGLV